MISGIGQGSWRLHEQMDTTATRQRQQSASNSNPGAAAGDSVDISNQSRQIHSLAGQELTLANNAPQWSAGQSTYGKLAGTANLGLKKYLGVNGQAADTSLAALNQNRKSLGTRIDTLLRNNGIKLGRDEKITISVDSKNNVTVGGIKDKAKRDAIERALNDDKKLAKDLKSHVAAGKINEAAKKQHAYEKEMGQVGDADPNDLFTNRGVRTFLIDEYLQNNTGLGVNDLQYERDDDGNVSIIGMNDEMKALFESDSELAATVSNMLENGETTSDFSVSFDFANGAISDSVTESAAKRKVEHLQLLIMGGVDEEGNEVKGLIDGLREKLEAANVQDDEDYKALMTMVSRGFSVRVAQGGTFEIVGAEKLKPGQAGMLEKLVTKALEIWADPESAPPDCTWNKGTEVRTASMADVADTYIEQHRFEHGDVDEYAHQVEINFAASGKEMIKVVSPEADEAQDEKNQENADELGVQLRRVLEEKGIDVGDGIEVEIDEDGKITVLGDPKDPTVRKAQQVLNQFTQEAKAVNDPENGKKADEERELAGERREVGNKGGSNFYEKLSKKEFVEAALAEIKPYLPTGDRPSLENSRLQNRYLSWKAAMPKTESGANYISNVDRVSSVQPRKYADYTEATGDGSVDELYADDARGSYRKLLDGMGQFHDERKRIRYRFTIA